MQMLVQLVLSQRSLNLFSFIFFLFLFRGFITLFLSLLTHCFVSVSLLLIPFRVFLNFNYYILCLVPLFF